MKKLVLGAVMMLSLFGASAQKKIGYINTDEIIGLMPEAEKVINDLKEYQASLQQQGEDMLADYYAKDSIYNKDSAKLSPSMKEIKKNELFSLMQRVQSWSGQMQQMMEQEQQKRVAPLETKAMDAVKAVAKENGYDYVLARGAVIVGPPGDDILPLVKKKLGIKDIPAPKKP
jgi:outer membrane protein